MKQFYMYVIHNLRSDQLAFSLYKKLIPKVANLLLLACIKWDLTLFFLFTVEKNRNRVNMPIKLKYATV